MSTARKRQDPLAVVEAAYRLDGDQDAWLGQVHDAVAGALGFAPRGVAATFDATDPAWVDISRAVNCNLPDEFFHGLLHQPADSPADARKVVAVFRALRFGNTSEFVFKLVPAFKDLYDRFGIPELIGFIATDPTFHGCMIAVAGERRRYPPRTSYLWHKIAAHVAAGLRLRRRLAELSGKSTDPVAHAEAVVRADHKIEHADGWARTPEGLAALREALVRMDAARGVRFDDGAKAIDLWGGLVAGRWSMVDHFERGGRRYFLAHRNDPQLGRHRALTLRERQVWAYATLGLSNKLIAYSLGLSDTSVATHLARARRKLGGQPMLDVLQALVPPTPRTVGDKPVV